MSEHHAQTKPNVIVRLMEVPQWQFFNIKYLVQSRRCQRDDF